LGIGIALFATRTPKAVSPQPSNNPAPAAAERGPRKTFALTVESTPSGSEVLESDAVLGTTPIVLSVDNDLARKALRRLVVRREGYLPYSIVQGPSDENVHVFAALVAAPTAKPQPASGKHAGKAGADASAAATAPLAPSPFPAASVPASPPPTDRPTPDIRLQR
jgi:serine/threonine-protein kinase